MSSWTSCTGTSGNSNIVFYLECYTENLKNVVRLGTTNLQILTTTIFKQTLNLTYFQTRVLLAGLGIFQDAWVMGFNSASLPQENQLTEYQTNIKRNNLDMNQFTPCFRSLPKKYILLQFSGTQKYIQDFGYGRISWCQACHVSLRSPRVRQI